MKAQKSFSYKTRESFGKLRFNNRCYGPKFDQKWNNAGQNYFMNSQLKLLTIVIFFVFMFRFDIFHCGWITWLGIARLSPERALVGILI